MKIGMVSRFKPIEDGIAIYTDNLVDHLRDLGEEVIKIGPKESKAKYHVDFNAWNLSEKLAKIIEKEKLDILHIQYIPPYFSRTSLNWNLIKALKQKIPVVVTFHEVYYKPSSIKEFLLKCIASQIIKKASKVIVHTKQQAKFLNKPNVSTVYMGQDPKRMHRKKHKNLLFFGLLGPNKGVHILLEAMSLLPGAQLTIAGKIGDNLDNKYGNDLKKLIEIQSLKNVNLEIGWVSEKRKDALFKEADLLVMPYVWAPYQSAAMHDAFSYGLPVVVTNIGCIHEVVEEFKMGIITEANDPKYLAESIELALKNYDKLQNGILDYRKVSAWDKVATKTLAVYNAAILH